MRALKAATHWSAGRLAREVGLSPATGHRTRQKYGLQPHRVEHFKFSTDPEFETKLADIVGLYLEPPERALVLCLDEKSQIQGVCRKFCVRSHTMTPGEGGRKRYGGEQGERNHG